jgi:hypothetical protein
MHVAQCEVNLTLPTMNEHTEQSTIIAWARRWEHLYPELRLLFAIPNGAALPGHTDRRGRRYSPQASKLKAEGLRPGVPDLFLPAARQGFHGMFIELKVGANKPTKEQVQLVDALADQGYYAAVCWGAEEAIHEIKEYLGIAEGL